MSFGEFGIGMLSGLLLTSLLGAWFLVFIRKRHRTASEAVLLRDGYLARSIAISTRIAIVMLSVWLVLSYQDIVQTWGLAAVIMGALIACAGISATMEAIRASARVLAGNASTKSAAAHEGQNRQTNNGNADRRSARK